MVNKSLLWLLMVSACASPGITETNTYEKVYTAKLIKAPELNEEDLLAFAKFIPLKVRELMDHASNANNEQYAPGYRKHSRHVLRSTINMGPGTSEKSIDYLIQALANASFQEVKVDPLMAVNPNMYAASVSIGNLLVMDAIIQKAPKPFGKDTIQVWDVRFETTASAQLKIPGSLIR